MYHSSFIHDKTLLKVASPIFLTNSTNHVRETTFDPFHYEFDRDTITEPFTYFNHGPTESRQKFNELLSPTLAHCSIVPSNNGSVTSSPDDCSLVHSSPVLNERRRGIIRSKIQQNIPHKQQQHQKQLIKQHSNPRTICRHCKSHNMPECLYTSHTMYDENGTIFCPVLKKCHCANCTRVTNSSTIRDDDSDDENHTRLPIISNEFQALYGFDLQKHSYHLHNNNNC